MGSWEAKIDNFKQTHKQAEPPLPLPTQKHTKNTNKTTTNKVEYRHTQTQRKREKMMGCVFVFFCCA